MKLALASLLVWLLFLSFPSSPAFAGTPRSKPKCPVVLVHGYLDTAVKLQKMASFLRAAGWTVFTPTLSPSNGAVRLEELAAQLETYIEARVAKSQEVDLVGFSMGGLICRYYAQRLGGMQRTRKLITIASPHHGTLTGYASGRPGCRQMRPGSAFLADLNKDAASLGKLDFTTIWTPLDLMIVPATSSRLGIGKEVVLWLPAHPLMVLSSVGWRAVASALAE